MRLDVFQSCLKTLARYGPTSTVEPLEGAVVVNLPVSPAEMSRQDAAALRCRGWRYSEDREGIKLWTMVPIHMRDQ